MATMRRVVGSLHSIRQPSVAMVMASVAVCLTGVARAQSQITLNLPPIAASSGTVVTASASTSVLPGTRREWVRKPMASRHMTARGAPSRHRPVVGSLGQLLRSAGFYRRPGDRSTIATAQAGTYVAVQQQEGGWCGILMADGSTGWVPAAAIRKLDDPVVSDATSSGPPPAPVGAGAGDIYPRQDRPFFTGNAAELIRVAESYLGVPYKWGGNTTAGIDCSGFVKNVFGALGFQLPRLGSDQMAYGVPVPEDQLQPGDRLYLVRRTNRLGVEHTALYMGNGLFIHASSGKHGVAISHLFTPKWQRLFVCARR
ncbi:MAG: C40 family peptidase [Armatimonadetes bacterium]|nr:C40 family peptidase [Armatimonadota bacterium]MDE2206851.1 C40 family peptidase [Armatimonadota bacterium]